MVYKRAYNLYLLDLFPCAAVYRAEEKHYRRHEKALTARKKFRIYFFSHKKPTKEKTKRIIVVSVNSRIKRRVYFVRERINYERGIISK